MKKEDCELCGKRARMYCESDQAKLCWDCDHNVHGANFLVAKHTRILLCRCCQSPTPWRASGPNLTPTASLCQRCVNVTANSARMNHEREHEDDDDDVPDDCYDGGDFNSDTDSEDYDDDEEEEGENQVVPWSTASSPPPDLAASSSSSEADGDVSSGTGCGGLSLKRLRENSLLVSDDEVGCSSSTSMMRPLKRPNQSPMVQNQRKAILMAQPHNP